MSTNNSSACPEPDAIRTADALAALPGVNIHTTCAGCTGDLLLTGDGSRRHPGCHPFEGPVWALTSMMLGAMKVSDTYRGRPIDPADTATPPTGRVHAALLYAGVYGWPVHPLRPGEKRPASRNGLKDATTDPDKIGEWWLANPARNIGVRTGIAFDVIDLDPPDCWRQVENLAAMGALAEVNAVVATQSGGLHLYVPVETAGPTKVALVPGVDIRAADAYVVMPGSNTATGRWTFDSKPGPALKKAVSQ